MDDDAPSPAETAAEEEREARRDEERWYLAQLARSRPVSEDHTLSLFGDDP